MTTFGTNKKRMLLASVVAVAAASVTQVSIGFTATTPVSMFSKVSSSSCLRMSSQEYGNEELFRDEDSSNSPKMTRRGMVSNMASLFGAALTVAAATTTSVQPAEASYSAYAAREKDWQERMDKGEIKVSSARQLRQQLSEIAPMNNEGKMMFCPNGASAAVTPMMENKCGERLATPSVYGRTQDIVGNSIPGFNGGKYPSQIPGGVGTLNAAGGIEGFPAYGSLKETGRANPMLAQ